MADQNGTDAAAAAPPTPWRLRLIPKPIGMVEIEDPAGTVAEYAVMSVMDIKSGPALEVLAAEEEIAEGKIPYTKIMELGKLQVSRVCPSLPSTVLDALSPNQVMQIRRKALGYDAANPPVPEEQETPSERSSGSSPRSAGSSVGRRKTSRT